MQRLIRWIEAFPWTNGIRAFFLLLTGVAFVASLFGWELSFEWAALIGGGLGISAMNHIGKRATYRSPQGTRALPEARVYEDERG